MSTADEFDRSRRGALILCGGGSRRMGRDKASLPFGGETMLARTMRLVAESVPREQIVLVAAAGSTVAAVAVGGDGHSRPRGGSRAAAGDHRRTRGAAGEGLGRVRHRVRRAVAGVGVCRVALRCHGLGDRCGRSRRRRTALPVERRLPAELRRVAASRVSTRGGSSLQGALRSPGFRLKELPVEQLRASILNCDRCLIAIRRKSIRRRCASLGR